MNFNVNAFKARYILFVIILSLFIKVSIVRRIANRYCSLVTMELNRNQFVDLDEQRPIKRSAPVTQTHFIKIEHLSAKVLKCWHFFFFKINPYVLLYTHRNSNTLSFFLFFRDIRGIVIYEDLINTLNDIKIVIREIL